MTRLSLILLGFFLSYLNAYASVGSQEISFLSKSSNRVITAEIYYPASCKNENKQIVHGIWLRENYCKLLVDKNTKQLYPLIIFSHGFQGDRFGNSWLAEKLVAKGYIVVMIDHTLNTSYENSDLFVYTSLWQRPKDMSELLTYLLERSEWNKVIDSNKIAVAGFSLGGTTALWLGGIRADKLKFKQALDDKYSRWSDWPERAVKKAQAVDWNKATQSYRDKRIKAVIAMAPDLGEAFTREGLMEASIPALIVVCNQDSITPKDENAEFYSKNIKGAEILVLNDVGHYVFMNQCSPLGLKLAPHLCVSEDAKNNIHKVVINKIEEFLTKILK